MFFFGLSNGLFLFYYLFFNTDRTKWDTAGQIGTLIAASQNIAYLVVTFARE